MANRPGLFSRLHEGSDGRWVAPKQPLNSALRASYQHLMSQAGSISKRLTPANAFKAAIRKRLGTFANNQVSQERIQRRSAFLAFKDIHQSVGHFC